MPPVTKAGGEAFQKDVEFVAKDAAEQVATGIVMVPDKVDLQNDFAREGTIRQFAEQFANFVDADEASGGVMHAVFPDDWKELQRNEVLDEAETIGGVEAPAGAWVQSWKYNDEDLWQLVDDGVLEGYSIGAVAVEWSGPYEQDADAVDDVTVPDEMPDDELVWELNDGIIREVSTVDIPAVPDAQILDTKADDTEEKRLSDHLGDRDGFVDEALQRGHSEEDAELLWDVLNRANEIEGAGEPGKTSMFARAGKAFLSALTPGDSNDEATRSAPAGDQDDVDDAAKAGRTLSKPNRDSLMASIDASLDVLEDAGVDHQMTRFSDRDDVDFELGEHEARSWSGGGEPEDEDADDGDEDEDEEDEVENHAPGGETPDDTMSDDDNTDPMEDAPEWAKSLHEKQQENSEQIEELAGGEKDAAGEDSDGDDPWDDAPEWAKALKEEQEKNAEAIETISKQSGVSTQLDAGKSADGDGESDDDSGLGTIGKALS